MEPLRPEGGHVAITYRAELEVAASALTDAHPTDRPVGGAILYLLTPGAWGFSEMHKLPSDELYHYHLGDPAQLLLLNPLDGTHEVITLGPDVLNGQRLQVAVPAGTWQGSRLLDGGDYTLMGTTMTPAFMVGDYIAGDRDDLIAQFPAAAAEVTALTRVP
jgi:uncharacterized protein